MDESRKRHLLRSQIRLVAYGPDRRETEDAMVAFGSNLRELRTVAGISQESLAMRCFMRRCQMWEIQSGRAGPDVPGLLTLAYGIGVPAAQLIEGLQAPVRRVRDGKSARRDHTAARNQARRAHCESETGAS